MSTAFMFRLIMVMQLMLQAVSLGQVDLEMHSYC